MLLGNVLNDTAFTSINGPHDLHSILCPSFIPASEYTLNVNGILSDGAFNTPTRDSMNIVIC